MQKNGGRKSRETVSLIPSQQLSLPSFTNGYTRHLHHSQCIRRGCKCISFSKVYTRTYIPFYFHMELLYEGYFTGLPVLYSTNVGNCKSFFYISSVLLGMVINTQSCKILSLKINFEVNYIRCQYSKIID
jgi:hypothetical protein